jgi:hypothetical protein
MGATTGWPRKVATCAGGIKTLEANIATTANGSANFRGNAIYLLIFDLFEGSVRDLKWFRFAEIIHHVGAARTDVCGFTRTGSDYPGLPCRARSAVTS